MTSAAATARPPLGANQISNETIWADPDDPQFDAYRISKIRAAPLIGRRFEIDTGRAQRLLSFRPRPAEDTLLDCARSLPNR